MSNATTIATSTAPVTLNPQIVGQAENAHLPVLQRSLAGTGITKNQWIALSLAMRAGGTIQSDRLVAQVTGALKVQETDARAAVTELTASALLEDLPGEAGRVGVTLEGRGQFERIRSANADVVARAYGGIPAEDLATAARVLITITTRLNKELAAA
jgi:hypothetical protein